MTLRGYRQTLKGVFAPLDPKLVSEITSADIAAILDPLPLSSQRRYAATLRAFLRWAAHPARSWCADASAVAGLEIEIDEPNEADIEILSVEEARALLAEAERHSPHAAVAFAVAIFAGVRPGELRKLTWKDIGPEHIEIGKDIAKKGVRRPVPVSPNLKAWIEDHRPADAADGDKIVGPCWDRVSCSVRRKAGWDVVAIDLADPPQPHRGRWKKNVLRHTCASLLVAIGVPLERLVFRFGHSGGHDLLRRHYVSRMTLETAREFFAIHPGGRRKFVELETVKTA